MTDDNLSHDLFISYSRKNKDVVLPIKDEIERTLGLTCWIDLSDIPCGAESFKKKVISGIKQTRIAFLFFLSAESQSSEYALREINFAKKRATKRVILIRFNDDQMTDEFFFDYQDADIVDWRISEQKEKLLRDLKNWANQRQSFDVASKDDVLAKFRKKYDWLKEEQFPSVGEPSEPGIYQNPDGGWQCNYGNWCVITLRPGQTEPHEVHGAICARWYQEGGAFNERCERGWLGYPTSDVEVYEGDGDSDDRISHFENGDIIWKSQTNECHVKPKSSDEHQDAETSCGSEGVVEPCMVHEDVAERKARKGVKRRTRVGIKKAGAASKSRHFAGKCKTIILPGGAEMEMIYCPPGEFMMGSPATERGRGDDETQHCVRLTKGFWLGKYPVTQQQWQSVMGTNPSKFKGHDLPVETVSWNDCQEFITRIGCGARLPTEAEWEYACRAGTIGKFGGSGILKELGWYFGNSWRYESVWFEEYSFFGKKFKEARVKKRQTQPVGKKEPNAWGLYDMHGNIWEWCMDWYGDYTAGKAVDPKGEVLGGLRVLRGGCWNYKADDCRSSCRNHDAPDRRSHYYGFRLCCSK